MGDAQRATVVGGGAFGTALALVLARKGISVRVWVRHEAQAAAVNAAHENVAYLPGTQLPSNIEWTCDINFAVADGCSLVMLVIPTQFLRSFLTENRSTLPVGVPIVLCAKGIEVNSLQTPFEILHDELPGKYAKHMAVLAGPSFAKEIAKCHMTDVVVASRNPEASKTVQQLLSSTEGRFRVYRNTDVEGCEIAGAVKNVLAIASGAVTGMGFGNNSRAALICRGLAEMTRLAAARGSSCKSMTGLAGVGDLLLTCSSELSRNFTVGVRIAKGETLDAIVASTQTVAEGVATAKAVHALCEQTHVEMPICQCVYRVLYGGMQPSEALQFLADRPLGEE